MTITFGSHYLGERHARPGTDEDRLVRAWLARVAMQPEEGAA